MRTDILAVGTVRVVMRTLIVVEGALSPELTRGDRMIDLLTTKCMGTERLTITCVTDFALFGVA